MLSVGFACQGDTGGAGSHDAHVSLLHGAGGDLTSVDNHIERKARCG